MYDASGHNDLNLPDDDGLSELRELNQRIAEEARAIIELSLDGDLEVVDLRGYAEDLDAIDEQALFVQTGGDLLTDALITAVEMTCVTASAEDLLGELADLLLDSGESLDSEHARLHLRAVALLPYVLGQAVDMADLFDEGDDAERTRRKSQWLRNDIIGKPGPALMTYAHARGLSHVDAVEAGLILLRWLESRAHG